MYAFERWLARCGEESDDFQTFYSGAYARFGRCLTSAANCAQLQWRRWCLATRSTICRRLLHSSLVLRTNESSSPPPFKTSRPHGVRARDAATSERPYPTPSGHIESETVPAERAVSWEAETHARRVRGGASLEK